MEKSNVERLIDAIAGDVVVQDSRGTNTVALHCAGSLLLLTYLLKYETSSANDLQDDLKEFEP